MPKHKSTGTIAQARKRVAKGSSKQRYERFLKAIKADRKAIELWQQFSDQDP